MKDCDFLNLNTMRINSFSNIKISGVVIKFFRNEKTDSNIFDVLILGAGLAGLGAAYTLRNTNLKFKLIEAQDYIGGRIKSTPLNLLENFTDVSSNNESAEVINEGAQWLHGEQNTLYEIAKKYNLIASELSEEGLGSYIRNDGFIFDECFRKKIDFLIGEILEECENFINLKEYPKSVGDFLEHKFNELLNNFHDQDERKKALELLDWHIRFQMIDNSCLNLHDVSAKEWGQYSFNGESCQAHINLKHGFSKLIDAIVNEIGGKDRILLKNQISQINWNCLANNKQIIEVRNSNNKVFYAKHVIVTFSLGVLKNIESNLFKPCLPDNYRKALRALGFDTINKIFLQFSQAWWGERDGIQLIYEKNDFSNWTRFISGFDVLNFGPSNTLLAWVGGIGAVEMEKLTDQQIIKDCLEILKKFTNHIVPNPIRYFCTRWNSNEFIKGGYSYVSVKCDKIDAVKKILSDPIDCYSIANDLIIDDKNLIDKNKKSNTATLRFAGEAYHNNYFSTAHGAFISGMEQAEKLLSN